MQLKTSRLNIRFVQEDDWESLLEIWRDFDDSPFAKYDAPHCKTEREAKLAAERWAKASSEKAHIFLPCALKKQ